MENDGTTHRSVTCAATRRIQLTLNRCGDNIVLLAGIAETFYVIINLHLAVI